MASEVQVGGLQPLQIWQHSLGICKIPNTDMQITNELCEDSITEPVYKKNTQLRLKAQAANGRYKIGSYEKNAV
jgi:hypothetical protein